MKLKGRRRPINYFSRKVAKTRRDLNRQDAMSAKGKLFERFPKDLTVNRFSICENLRHLRTCLLATLRETNSVR